MYRLLACLILIAATAQAAIVRDVRTAIAGNNFAAAERLVAEYRQAHGVTPEMLEAYSWLGRGALAAKQFDQAEEFATRTRELTLKLLDTRQLDEEKHLPVALGASIEVQAQAMAARGALSESIAFLRDELERWRGTLIHTRIQKNVNLLNLEGKAAPPLDLDEYVGEKPEPLASLKGKVVLLFFWAHWCPDCKYEAPILARLRNEYGNQGLVIIGPTKRYGFARRGEEVSPEQELRYIDQVRSEQYGAVAGMTVPVSTENLASYGSSTTPTLVLVDREGIVRLYHPGEMSYEELAPKVAELM